MKTNYVTTLLLLLVCAASAGGAQQHDSRESGQSSPGAFGHAHALAVDGSGQGLFMGAHTGLFHSQDGGRSWARVTLSASDSGYDVMSVTIDPRNPKMIFVATHEAGVFRSIDAGKRWEQINKGLGGFDVHGLALDPNDGKLYALVRDKGEGMFRSNNAGRDWTRVDDGPGGEVKVLASVNTPSGMGGIFLYAGTAAGLKRTADCF